MRPAIIAVLFSLLPVLARADEPKARPNRKVYGEWRIRPRADKGAEYRQLIEQQGLPLFRAAGGRMVGWWNTLIGNLYEHVTIWEYDDMAAFQKAVEYLGGNEQFAKFVALRDPLLAGEESRFLRPAAFAEPPRLPETAPYVIHEIHRVPLRSRETYLRFMEAVGLPLLKKHGFRPAGPWLVEVGKWTEVTYLFRFDSLAERERRIADFSASTDARVYGKVNEVVDEITTRLLIPTPFAAPREPKGQSLLLPHLEQVAPGVYAAGFAERYRSANCGWVTQADGTLLVDLPRGVAAGDHLKEVARLAGKPASRLLLTRFEPGDAPTVAAFIGQGNLRVITSPDIANALLAAPSTVPPSAVQAPATDFAVGDGPTRCEFIPLDGITGKGGGAVFVPAARVLFGGPLVTHGTRARLAGADTGRWFAALRQLEQWTPAHVVPGFGSWGGDDVLTRQRQFLSELRRQVAYVIAQGRPPSVLRSQVRVSDELCVAMPYDYPTAEDVVHVYGELTVPAAPFNGRPPEPSDTRPHALVLIGDQPHEPGHLEDGLRPALEAAGVVPHFAVDVRALSAENLARVRLLVILRDGLQHPTADPKADYVWMTPEQERAVVAFVDRGGGFLNLHNALGLYPENGPYLKLAGGRFRGHGPLERFRVEVTNPDHAITRGVTAFSVLDEQHDPAPDTSRVRLLLRSRSDDGKVVAAAGWVSESGQGRVCHLAPGHTREALLHPMYQRLVRNAAAWCVRRDAKDAAVR